MQRANAHAEPFHRLQLYAVLAARVRVLQQARVPHLVRAGGDQRAAHYQVEVRFVAQRSVFLAYSLLPGRNSDRHTTSVALTDRKVIYFWHNMFHLIGPS